MNISPRRRRGWKSLGGNNLFGFWICRPKTFFKSQLPESFKLGKFWILIRHQTTKLAREIIIPDFSFSLTNVPLHKRRSQSSWWRLQLRFAFDRKLLQLGRYSKWAFDPIDLFIPTFKLTSSRSTPRAKYRSRKSFQVLLRSTKTGFTICIFVFDTKEYFVRVDKLSWPRKFFSEQICDEPIFSTRKLQLDFLGVKLSNFQTFRGWS